MEISRASDIERVSRVLCFLGLQNGEIGDAQPHTFLKQKVAEQNAAILGGPEAGAEISQWLSFSRNVSAFTKQELNRLLSSLNSMLACRSYLVGNCFTLADASVAEAVIGQKLAKYPEILRWLIHVVMFCPGSSLPANIVPKCAPLVFPVMRGEAKSQSSSVDKEAKPSAGKDGESKSDGSNKKSDKKAEKKEKAEKKDKVKGGGAGKGAGDAVAAPSGGGEELDPSKLDFRVGCVVKCWNHPDAEKLLCEEIDLGESTGCRQIASGLRQFYSAEEVQGRKVIVLANLKDRNLVGFKSQGMVICASNEDHSVVKLLEPPVNANVGDRVTFDGFEGNEPASASQVAKKKIFEKLMPGLKTTEAGVATWNALPFKIGGEPCRADLSNGSVG